MELGHLLLPQLELELRHLGDRDDSEGSGASRAEYGRGQRKGVSRKGRLVNEDGRGCRQRVSRERRLVSQDGRGSRQGVSREGRLANLNCWLHGFKSSSSGRDELSPNSTGSGGCESVRRRRDSHHITVRSPSPLLLVAHGRDAAGLCHQLLPPRCPDKWPILFMPLCCPVLREVALGLEVLAAESVKRETWFQLRVVPTCLPEPLDLPALVGPLILGPVRKQVFLDGRLAAEHLSAAFGTQEPGVGVICP